MGEPLRLVPSEALAMIYSFPRTPKSVIEGVLIPNKRAVEGPLLGSGLSWSAALYHLRRVPGESDQLSQRRHVSVGHYAGRR